MTSPKEEMDSNYTISRANEEDWEGTATVIGGTPGDRWGFMGMCPVRPSSASLSKRPCPWLLGCHQFLVILSLNLCFVSGVWWDNRACERREDRCNICVHHPLTLIHIHDAAWAQDSSGPTVLGCSVRLNASTGRHITPPAEQVAVLVLTASRRRAFCSTKICF